MNDKKLSESTWDRELAAKLRKELKLTQEQIGAVIGIVAEHRQLADRDGYKRGYNNGYYDGRKKYSSKE